MTFVAGTVLTAAALNSELAAKTDLAMAKNAQTGTSYSYALADQTKLLTMSNAAANTVTVTKQATVAWAADTQLRVLNIGAGATTLVADTGVTINNNTALAQWRGGVLIRMSSDVWTFVPFASGVGAAVFSDTPTGTYTGYAYKTFTASGTLNVTTAGFADIVVQAGGGSGGSNRGGAGGAGGTLSITNAYLPVGPLTVTIGAGGAADANAGSRNGLSSRVGSFFASGGGSGGNNNSASALLGNNGGSGGGGGAGSAAGGAGDPGLGSAGGTGFATDTQSVGAAGGGGGAAAVGANAASGVGGAGGAGSTTTIAGTTPSGAYVAGSYALGGGGGGGAWNGTGGTASSGGGAGSGTATGTAGTANTGGGGGGGGRNVGTPGTGGNGGSGIVIVRVAV